TAAVRLATSRILRLRGGVIGSQSISESHRRPADRPARPYAQLVGRLRLDRVRWRLDEVLGLGVRIDEVLGAAAVQDRLVLLGVLVLAVDERLQLLGLQLPADLGELLRIDRELLLERVD